MRFYMHLGRIVQDCAKGAQARTTLYNLRHRHRDRHRHPQCHS